MLDDETAIADVLAGSGLRRAEVVATHFGGPAALAPRPEPDAERVFVIECSAADLDGVWQAAAHVVDATGRWPVVTAGFDGEPLSTYLWGTIPPSDSLPDPLSDETLDRRISELVDWHDAIWIVDEDELDFHLNRTAARVGSAPSAAEVRRELTAPIGDIELNVWLYRWETAHAPTQTTPVPDAYLQPFKPPQGACGVVLLPTAQPWLAAALMSFHGVNSVVTQDVFVSLLHRWHTRWGVEFTANYGTVLDARVHFPPVEAEDVLAVAVEQAVLAHDTIGLPGVSLRDHARALAGRKAWHLHDRP